MRKKLTCLFIGLALFSTGARSDEGSAQTVKELMDRARQWEGRGRDDLARQELARIFLISPDDPGALTEMGALDVRTGNLPDAKSILDHLKKVSPDHKGVTRITDLLRLYGPDKDRLRQARLLAKSGRRAEALAKFNELYPNGPPDADLALEYWQLEADSPGGYEPARLALAKLTQDYPDNRKYRLALAKLEVTRAPLDRRALGTLIEFSRMPEYEREAKAAWRGALLRFGENPAYIPLLKDYLQMDPKDTAVRQQLEETVRAREKAMKEAEEKKRLASDPYYQAGQAGIAALQSGHFDEAQRRLDYAVSGRPDDAEILGAIGLLRFRQGHDFEAQAYFMKAMKLDPSRNDKWIPLLKAAKFWGSMKEYHDAEEAGETGLAEMKLKLALSVDPSQPDALAALGHVLEKKGSTQDAENAYRKALGFAPDNASALQGLFSLYLDSGRMDEAGGLLSDLSAAQKASLGHALESMRSDLLRKKADLLLAEGKNPEAASDLEEAVAINPDDPWLRYDLAKLLVGQKAPGKAESLFSDYLKNHPDDPSGLYAYALVLSSEDKNEEALRAVDKISKMDEKTASFRKRLVFRIGSAKAKSLDASGDREGAQKLASRLERDAANDAGLQTDAAYLWADVGNLDHALDLLKRLDGTEMSVGWRLDYARFLNRHRLDMSAELAKIAPMKRSPDETIALKGLQELDAIAHAEALRKAGQSEEAARLLEPFIRQNPDSAKLLIEEAKIRTELKRTDLAEEDYLHALASDPVNVDAIEGLASLYIDSGRPLDADKLVSNLTREQRQSLGKHYDSIRSAILRKKADALLSGGDRQEAERDLIEAMRIDPDDPWLRYDLARLYLGNREPEKADSLFTDFLKIHPGDPSGLYAYALLLSSEDRNEDALHAVDAIPPQSVTEKIREYRQQLVETIAVRQSEELFRNGRAKEAEQGLQSLLSKNPESASLLLAMASIDLKEKRFADAEAIYRKILAKNPNDARARSGLIEALVDEGHLLEALNQVQGWLSVNPDTSSRLEEIGILIDLEDYPAAWKKNQDLLASDPGNARALAYAEKISDLQNPALQPYPAAKLTENALPPWLKEKPKPGRLSKSEAEALDATIGWVSTAADVMTRSGTPGESQFKSVEVPLEWKTPMKSGQGFVRMDAVQLDAGILAPEDANFGTLLFCQPNCPAVAQTAKGMSFTAGYNEGKDLRLDIGTTPLGFPVSHVLGGFLKKGDLGPFSYSVDLSRRPITSTLLSYSGTQDPRTGLTWGGVVATGPSLGLSLDKGGAFGFWSDLEYHKLTGDNVESNTRKRAMAGGYWRAINEDDRELKVGLTGMYWNYAVDAGEFTFGHGGYYSPQRYESLSIPVSFGQRISNFSYLLRASVTTSYATFNSAPYFPTNQAMQAQGNSYYTASSGPGSGYSLLADWEYLMAPELYLGGQFDIERSVYYAPNHLLIYLRHPIGGSGSQQVFEPPELFEPTSHF